MTLPLFGAGEGQRRLGGVGNRGAKWHSEYHDPSAWLKVSRRRPNGVHLFLYKQLSPRPLLPLFYPPLVLICSGGQEA